MLNGGKRTDLIQHEVVPLQRCSGNFLSINSNVKGGGYSNIDQNKHIVKRKWTHTQPQTHMYTCTAFLERILSRSPLSFDPIGVFFWPTYWVDPPGFGLFALVKCVQWHTPLMRKYRLYRYKTLGWPIAYWFEEAVCIPPRLQVDKNSFCNELAEWTWPSEMHMENNQWKHWTSDVTRMFRLLLNCHLLFSVWHHCCWSVHIPPPSF